MINIQVLGIVQPDIYVCGGIMEMKKIEAMAEVHYMTVAPQDSMSPLATMVNIHCVASTPNFLILEYRAPDDDARRDVLDGPPMVKDGYAEIPNKPGWGVEVNEKAFKHYPSRPWKRTTDSRGDGSVAFI